MALLTKPLIMTPDWVEITSAFNMADGKKYVIEPRNGLIELIDTDDNVAPGKNDLGHLHLTATLNHRGDYREFNKKAGHFLWGRGLSGNNIFIVSTEI